MMERPIERIRAYIDGHPDDVGAYTDLVSAYDNAIQDGETGWHRDNKALRAEIGRAQRRAGARGAGTAELRKWKDAYWHSALVDAPVDFDAFMLYTEHLRDPNKRFYAPRRNKLIRVVNSIQRLMDDELDLLGVSLPPGVGKLLADDTLVMTRNGWKKHGDLRVGDYVVGIDGKYKKVLHVFPKDEADYEVEFTNGDRIKCHGNHEWLVYNRHRQKEEILTTEEMLNGGIETGIPGKRGHRYHYLIPERAPMEGTEAELPMRPYLLGAWLGDGTSNKPAVTLCNSDTIILAEFMRDYKLTHIYDQVGCKQYVFDWMRDDLHKMGMCYAHRNVEKYIPDVYLTASTEQRLDLLAGLIDTDGTVSDSGKYSISTTNVRIRDSICELVSTFGWRTTVTEYLPTVSSSGIAGKKTVYNILFCPKMPVPCRVKRKRNEQIPCRRRVSIKAIRKISPVQGNCIEVEGGMYCAGRTMIPTHNSTLSIFLLTWVSGRWPDEPNLTGSHSNAFVRGVYDECLRMLDKDGEYLWHEVFPNVNVSNTNAKDLRIDLGKRKRFETLEFTSIGSGNAGLYRAKRLLYCDDLISGLEIALSKERLDKLWETYTTDLRQRKIGDHCKELHVATRWSLNDVIGRLERQYEGSDRAEFIVVPALDENDESNFDYQYGVGFSTSFYREQRDVMEESMWRALYMNQPIEREGLLYDANELRRYFELPDKDPDAILCVCDTKDKGTDYCVMPIAYQYGSDYYIDDVVCDNSNPEIIEPRLAQKCVAHGVHMGRFESNSAGGRVAQAVQEMIRAQGGKTKLTTKYTTQNKETKIIMASPFVKEHFLFKDDSVVKDKEYRRFMSFLCSYTMSGKNKWDDVPDAVSMLADYAQTFIYGQVQVIARPF